jgi:hypothetical protein
MDVEQPILNDKKIIIINIRNQGKRAYQLGWHLKKARRVFDSQKQPFGWQLKLYIEFCSPK